MATITSKGQITIPKDVRDALGLRPGTQVEFELEQGRVVLRRRAPEEALRRWEGYLAGNLPGRTVDETMEMLRGERLPPRAILSEQPRLFGNILIGAHAVRQTIGFISRELDYFHTYFPERRRGRIRCRHLRSGDARGAN